ncbi:MAG: hypothetical protein ACFFG0_35925 [Candidatus Thorarchaeota archaeon]
MKYTRISILLFLVCIFITSTFSLNATAEEGKIDNVTSIFSENPIRQDEDAWVKINLENTGDGQIKIYWVGIHFDWLGESSEGYDLFYNKDLSSDPIILENAQSTTIRINFDVEVSVDIGTHSYYFHIDYEEKSSDLWGWYDHEWESEEKFNYKVLEKDRDGDGVGDSEDAFPDNPNETKDSDNDGVGDIQDDYPYDPTKTIRKDESESSDISSSGDSDIIGLSIFGIIILIIILIVVIVLIIAGLYMSRKKKHQSENSKQPSTQRFQDREQHSPTPRQKPKQSYENYQKTSPQAPPPRRQDSLPQQYHQEYTPPPPVQQDEETLEYKERLKIPKFCPECGATTTGRNFCRDCGTRLE